jgi:sulfite exporter TauE/SafE
LYNLGRVVSYTIVGVIVGALGSIISFSGWMKGLVQLAAGIFMIIMGINMLGVFPGLRKFSPRLPAFLTRRMEAEQGRSNSPLYIGLLNGLMPCGPLQAMQLYALSTGDPVKGGLSMLLFSLGTVPLMFGLGALSSLLSTKFTKKVMTVGAVLVLLLGMSMFSNGWSLSGLSLPAGFMTASAVPIANGTNTNGANGTVIENNVQLINSTLSSGRYPPITVQVGIPVKWTIDAPQGSINGCNNRMIIPEYNIEHRFTTGANVVEFTPVKTGTFRYSCWMGMIRSSITVIEAGAVNTTTAAAPAVTEENWWDDGSWEEPAEPVPAGFRIPTKNVAIAAIGADSVQRLTLELSDRGFSPAAAIIQGGLKTEWTINNVSLREENAVLLFPSYGQAIPFENGENTLFLLPREDFAFSTSDSEYFGFIKVVDNLEDMDIEALKVEIGGYQTMIYPSSYFQFDE